MKSEFIQVKLVGPLAHLELNRPNKRNALHRPMVLELRHTLDALKSQKQVRAVVLRGKGDHFCAGADLEEMKASLHLSFEQNELTARDLMLLLKEMILHPLPILASVHGANFGGALGLIAACDFVISDNQATFCLSEAKLGLAPAMISPFLIQKMGVNAFKKASMFATTFTADEAKACGLVYESMPLKQHDQVIEGWTNRFLELGPNALSAIKQLCGPDFAHKNMDVLVQELPRTLAEIRNGAEAQEGLKAFFEKRDPTWKEK